MAEQEVLLYSRALPLGPGISCVRVRGGSIHPGPDRPRRRKEGDTRDRDGRGDGIAREGNQSPHRRVFGWTFGWFIAIWLFGFTIGAPLSTFLQLKVGEREKWPLTLILTGVTWAFIYGVFKLFLHVPFPPGQLLLWLKQLPSI